jgi:hypothetical protein
MYICVPVHKSKANANGSRDIEHTRINMDDVTDYRPFKTDGEPDYTAIFFNKNLNKPMVVALVPVEKIDMAIGTLMI